MNVLLTGATGLIGGRLRSALLEAGCTLRCPARRAPLPEHPRSAWRQLDFAEATDAACWLNLCEGIDVVVNAVGIFREHDGARFDALHRAAPCALFRAAAAAGVPRVVHVSALGARAGGTGYQSSKAAAEACLLALPLEGVVLQPSLVFAPQGRSSSLFLALATMPVLVLPDGGRSRVSPVHIDDVVEVMSRLVLAPRPPAATCGRRIALAGPRALGLADYLQTLRAGLALRRAPVLALPAVVSDAAARLGGLLPGALLDRDALTMLREGNSASPAGIAAVLGRTPRDPCGFVPPAHAADWRLRAQMFWLLPMLRASIAAVWLGTALVSAGLYPIVDSYALLARAGVPGPLQPVALWGAVALDLLLGVLTVWPGSDRRWLWKVQAGLILLYTAIITLRLPEFWLHPYGPLLKNVPMLAMLWLLATLERPAARGPSR